MKIIETSPTTADAVALIEELSQILEGITGNDGKHSFDTSDVMLPRSIFVLAYDEHGKVLGCGAFRSLTEDIAEVKRMYARSRTRGVGTEILNYLERKATEFGYSAVRLETRLVNEQAVSFYEKKGYQRIHNYGNYAGRPEAVCFEKTLAL